MRGFRTGLIAAALTLVALPGAAGASCGPSSLPERIAHSQVIVYGTVVLVEQPARGGTYYTVELERVYKGAPRNPVILHSASGRTMQTSVDYPLREGEAHTLYLTLNRKGYYETNLCTGSHPGTPQGEEAALLGPGAAPPPLTPPGVGGLRQYIPFIAIGATFAAIAFVLVGPRLLRRGGR